MKIICPILCFLLIFSAPLSSWAQDCPFSQVNHGPNQMKVITFFQNIKGVAFERGMPGCGLPRNMKFNICHPFGENKYKSFFYSPLADPQVMINMANNGESLFTFKDILLTGWDYSRPYQDWKKDFRIHSSTENELVIEYDVNAEVKVEMAFSQFNQYLTELHVIAFKQKNQQRDIIQKVSCLKN